MEFYKERLELEKTKIAHASMKQFNEFLKLNIIPKSRIKKEKLFYHIHKSTNINEILKYLKERKPEINLQLIKKVHDSYLKNIVREQGFRKQNIKIAKNSFKPAKAKNIENDLKLLIKWFNEHKNKINPLVQAILFYHKFEKIHPFLFGNEATGRIIMNYILFLSNYPPIIIKGKYKKEHINSMNESYKNINEDLLNNNPENYQKLINFFQDQFISNYWRIFI